MRKIQKVYMSPVLVIYAGFSLIPQVWDLLIFEQFRLDLIQRVKAPVSVRRFQKRPSKPKSPPFTDEQISLRAYEIWQRRGQQGTPDENWQAAIVELQRERSPIGKLRQTWQKATDKDNRDFTLELVKIMISAFGVLATIFAGVGLYLTYQNSQADRQLNNERLVTDRFAKAVEQLGSQNVHVRLGAIYSLERIAKDSPKDHWTVMEVLTAFVRDKSRDSENWIVHKSEPYQALPNLTIDMESALTVIGRREAKHDPEGKQLNLKNINLSGADLRDADLTNANLSRALINKANLSRADFTDANLSHAQIGGAKLNRAILSRANLSNSHLANTNLSEAFLSDADLSDANLILVNLSRANLSDANLIGSILIGARPINLGQIKEANNWQKAHYDDDFRKKLGLSPEKP